MTAAVRGFSPRLRFRQAALLVSSAGARPEPLDALVFDHLLLGLPQKVDERPQLVERHRHAPLGVFEFHVVGVEPDGVRIQGPISAAPHRPV